MKTRKNNQIIIELLGQGTKQQVAIKDMLSIDTTFIDMNRFLKKNEESILVKINHSAINSTISLTNVYPYTILLFNKRLEFKGVTYSIKSSNGDYSLQTQYKILLFVKHPNPLNINTITDLSFTKTT